MNEQFVPVSEYIKVAWRRRWLIFLVTAAIVLATAIKLFVFTDNMYRAEGVFIVKPKSAGASSMMQLLGGGASLMPGLSGGSSYDIPALLKSRRLAEEVAKNPSVMEGYNAEYKIKFDKTNLVKRIKDSVSLDNSKMSSITIYYMDRNPRFAADMANLFMDTLSKNLIMMSKGDASSKSTYIQTQIDKQLEQLERIEAKTKTFEESVKSIALSDEMQFKLKGYYDLKLQYERDMIDKESLQKQYDMRSGQTSGSDSKALDKQIYANDPTLQVLKNKLSDAQIDLLKNKDILKPDSVIIKQNRAKIATLTKELKEYTQGLQKNVINGIIFERAVLDSKIAGEAELMKTYEDLFKGAPAEKLDYERLMRDKKIAEQVYIYLRQELEKSKLDEQTSDIPLRILDKALPPEKRFSPKITLGLVIAGFSGLFLGILCAFTYDLLQRVRAELKA